MAIDEEIEPKTILRRTRIETTPYLRELAEHRRALLPRMEISRRWIGYYDALSKTRPLRPAETRRLEAHRKTLGLATSRIEVLRAAGRYGRTRKPRDLLALRQAQKEYYESKVETLPPEKQKEAREKLVPPKEMYDEWADLKKDISEKCKRLKTARRAYELPVTERYVRVRTLTGLLQEDYVRLHELTQKGMGMPELIKHYREMKEAGER